MSRIAVVGACVGCLVFASVAECAELLFGVEQVKVSANVEGLAGDASVRHGWTAATVDWLPTKILRVHAALGGITSQVDDASAPGMESQDDKYLNYVSVGVGLDQELDTGGALGLDFTWSTGKVEWADGGNDYTYRHMRTVFSITYAFLEPDKARPYVGFNYNTYEGDLNQNGALLDEFEYAVRLNAIIGIRARTDTMLGVMEATLGGEIGVRLGLEFGF